MLSGYVDCSDFLILIMDLNRDYVMIASSYRYGNGDVYTGHWSHDQRVGFGRLEENSLKHSCYIGSWSNNKRNGYGIYEDKMRSAELLKKNCKLSFANIMQTWI